MGFDRARKNAIRAEMARLGVRYSVARRSLEVRAAEAALVATVSASIVDGWDLVSSTDLAPFAPFAANLPAGWLLAGEPGAGKSMASWSLAAAAVKEGGSATMLNISDWHFPSALADGSPVQTTDLWNAPVGALSPFGMLGSPFADQSLVIDVIRSLVGYPLGGMVGVIRRIVGLVGLEDAPSLNRVADLLQLSDDADVRKVGQDLTGLSGHELANLVFPACAGRLESGPVGGLQVITTRNRIDVPSSSEMPSSWRGGARVGITVVHLVVQQITERALSSDGRSLVCVENSELLWTPWGAGMLSQFFRQTRSAEAALVLSTWSLTGMPDCLDSMMTERLMFRHSAVDGRERAVRLLDADPQNRWVTGQLRELRAGECLWRHLDGQVVRTLLHVSDADRAIWSGDRR